MSTSRIRVRCLRDRCPPFCSVARRAATSAPLSADRCPGALDIPPTGATLRRGRRGRVPGQRRAHEPRPATPLRRDADLAQAARRHARDMARRDYFAHVSPAATRSATACAPPATATRATAGASARTSAGAPAARATPERARRRVARQPAAPPHPARSAPPRARRRRRAAARRRRRRTGLPGATYATGPRRRSAGRLSHAQDARHDRIRSVRRPLRRHLDGRPAAARPRPAPATAGDWDGAGWRTPDPAGARAPARGVRRAARRPRRRGRGRRRARRARSTRSTCTTR